MTDAINNQSAEADQEKTLSGSVSRNSIDGWTLGDRYEVLARIGSGGMGVVYKARHVMMDKLVAVKTLKLDNMLNDTARKRFEHEAKLCAKLSHTNVVSIHDFGISGDLLYLVMDYVDGKTLEQILDVESCLSVERTVEIMTQVADGLDHAHQYGVLHRDVKPSNIMIVKSPSGQDVAKIVDFGLAKMTLQDGQLDRLTQTGAIMGSVMYLSPEQCFGRHADLRSDIYALGCVLYEMLVGMPAFAGTNVLETIRKHTDENPLPINQVREDLQFPQVLEDVILKALCKDPDQRFQTVNEFKQALLDARNSVVNGGARSEKQASPSPPTASMPVSISGQNGSNASDKKPSIKTPAVIAAAVGAVLLVVAGIANFKHDGPIAKPPRTESAPVSQDTGTDFSAGQVALLKGQYSEAETLFRQALEEANSQKPDTTEGSLRIAITSKLIDVLYIEKKFAEADELSASLNSAKTVAAGNERPSSAGAPEATNDRLARLAAACHKEGQCDTAASILEHSVDLSKRVYGASSPQTLAKMQKLAEFYETLGEDAKAEKLTMEIMQRKAGTKVPATPHR
jgi:serine/threonine protein kinase